MTYVPAPVKVGEAKWFSKSGDFVKERTLVSLTTLEGANIFGERMGARRGWTNQEAPPVDPTNQRQHGSTCRAGFHIELNNFVQVKNLKHCKNCT